VDLPILEAVHDVNERQKQVLPEKVNAYFDHKLSGKKIAIWGLAFKPRTDDVREAPSLVVIEHLINGGAEVVAFDPEAMNNVKGHFEDKLLSLETRDYEAIEGVDAI